MSKLKQCTNIVREPKEISQVFDTLSSIYLKLMDAQRKSPFTDKNRKNEKVESVLKINKNRRRRLSKQGKFAPHCRRAQIR